ncbi:DNA repair protein [[Clostridium] innocuum]|jgi:DNA polymerase V|uniref:Y-family DNA polymerase n=1 Tax=Clostridium innocuum TaxID=1522 RepID=UPI001F5915BF|nr:DNA repair protein [[Clostridium] innocuum]MCI2981570.1 DNA repair protein [[Clostridium] innocuum]MCR0195348.1 DNA repair protein [[Clostridium] innocuum]MCR0495468.1 DNA repair protein [[Clostridium] innocuum]MCR0528528.1 DNA repair protein [[Clostridium] innocuum]
MMKAYLCIDLKTFFASVECVERKLDPFAVNLVVADPSRGKSALCLAVSPKMKEQGVHNRCRIFEIPDNISYITAMPRMNLYMQYSADIYGIYLKYISREDIHVYSIDEAFLDVSEYLQMYSVSAKELARMILQDIYTTTGITATVGIGTNLYLAKIALDITAKHAKDNMGILDEQLYRETLWHHKPVSDFWQVGRGISKRLEKYSVADMYDIAHMDERILYREFGVNAEYLIDHAWGREPTTIKEIKAYKSKSNSLSNSQILFEDYNYEEALLVLKEMVELNVQNLVESHRVTDHIGLYIGYSARNVKATGGSRKLSNVTNSYAYLRNAFIELYRETVNRQELVHMLSISFGNVVDEMYETYDLFTDFNALEKEKKLQLTLLNIKHKFGKNAVIKGMNLLNKATAISRNKLVGGHNAE